MERKREDGKVDRRLHSPNIGARVAKLRPEFVTAETTPREHAKIEQLTELRRMRPAGNIGEEWGTQEDGE